MNHYFLIVKNALLKYTLHIFYFVVIISCIKLATKIPEPRAYGDGPEYLLQTESLRNHFSPELRIEDYLSLKKRVTKLQDWSTFYHYKKYQENIDRYNENGEVRHSGYYKALNGSYYCYHFWFYSLMNLPASYMVDLLHLPPNYAFILTHFIILLVLIYYLLFKFQKNNLNAFTTIILSLLIFFSPVSWYLRWIHTEYFTSLFVLFSILLALDKKYYWALLLSSLAAMHFQPLFLLSIFYIVLILIEFKITIKSLLKIGLTSFWIIIPPLFYYLKFGIPNIIIDKGFLSNDRITWNRFIGFFLDLDQGMILGLPLILPFTFIVTFYLLFIKKSYSKYMLLWVIVILATIPGLAMLNWNHGMSNINRYATWISMMVLGLFIVLWIKEKWKPWYLILFLLTQILTFQLQKGFHSGDSDIYRHKNLAKFFLNHFPNSYNPDPTIFCIRTNASFKIPPITRYYYNDELIKILVRKDAFNSISELGFSENEITQLAPKIKYNYGYGYINKKHIPDSVRINKNNYLYNILCDCETIKPDSSGYISQNGLFFFKSYRENFTNKKSFSGKNSCYLTKDSPYGTTIYMPDIKPGNKVKLSVYKSEKDWGSIVAQAKLSNFRRGTNTVVSKENGWYKVTLEFVVPKIDGGFIFFTYNPGEKECYFDDFKIEVLR